MGRSLRPPNRSGTLGVGCAELTRSRDEGSCRLLEEPLGASRSSGQAIGDERPRAASPLDQTRILERPVGLRDGVGRELELLGERSDSGQAFARSERAAVDPFGQRRRELLREGLG